MGMGIQGVGQVRGRRAWVDAYGVEAGIQS